MFLHDTCLCESLCRNLNERDGEKGWFSDCYKVKLDLEKDDSVWCMTFPYTAYGCGLTLALKKPKFEYRDNYSMGKQI